MSDYGLICPFLTDDPVYAHGVEFGMLYARMRDGGEDVIEDHFLIDNEEQVLLLASRLGWRATKRPCESPGWCLLTLERPQEITS